MLGASPLDSVIRRSRMVSSVVGRSSAAAAGDAVATATVATATRVARATRTGNGPAGALRRKARIHQASHRWAPERGSRHSWVLPRLGLAVGGAVRLDHGVDAQRTAERSP